MMENNVRLIDANALEFQYAHMIYPNGTESMGYHAYVTSVQIKDAPTIDPESMRPVGRWEQYLDFWRKCSLCGENWHEQWVMAKHLNFCPNCGAKMEG